MSSVKERLCTLYEELGFGVLQGDSDYAFINAFAETLEDVLNCAQKEFDAITNPEDSRLLELLGVDFRRYNSREKALEKAQYMLSQKYGEFSQADYSREVEASALGGSNVWYNMVLYLYQEGYKKGDYGLKRLGDFLKQYLPAWALVLFAEGGLSFDDLESFSLTFSETDSFGVPFYTLESL